MNNQPPQRPTVCQVITDSNGREESRNCWPQFRERHANDYPPPSDAYRLPVNTQLSDGYNQLRYTVIDPPGPTSGRDTLWVERRRADHTVSDIWTLSDYTIARSAGYRGAVYAGGETAYLFGSALAGSSYTSHPRGSLLFWVARIDGYGDPFIPTGLRRKQQAPRENQPELTAYPNPARSQLTIKNLQKPAPYHLYDMQGIEVQKGTAHPSQPISLDAVPKGVYLLRTGTQAMRVVKE